MKRTSSMEALPKKKVVLITGCSAGGIGDALAQAFHKTGKCRVFATGRNLSRIGHFEAMGIETQQLDVESASSIRSCVEAITRKTDGVLDILVNNSGAGYNMPVLDIDEATAKDLFNLNVFAVMAVTKAFIPLILKSSQAGRNPVILNQSSAASVLCGPFSGVYNASKAALSSFTETMRLELDCFGIGVVDLKTTMVLTNMRGNLKVASDSGGHKLPRDSIFMPVREIVEERLKGDHFVEGAISPEQYAESVVSATLKNQRNPPARMWKGGMAWILWFGRTFLPSTFMDGELRKMGRLPEIKKMILSV